MEPSLPDAISALVNEGHRSITIAPIFMRCELQHAAIDELIEEYNVRALKRAHGFERQKLRIARTCANQIDDTEGR